MRHCNELAVVPAGSIGPWAAAGRPAAAVLVLRRGRAEPHKGKVEREKEGGPPSLHSASPPPWLGPPALTGRKATKRAS